MRLTKFAQACVRLESDRGVLVFDPGIYSDPSALDSADGVLVSHEHVDHVDVNALVAAARARPTLRVVTHSAVATLLSAVADQVTVVGAGEQLEVAGYRVRTVGGQHGVIHPDIPRIANLGFLVDEHVYHPGDSFAVPEDSTVDTVLVPVSGPWLKTAEAIDFVRAVRPQQAIAIHDLMASDLGLSKIDELFGKLAPVPLQRLPVGGGAELH